MGMFGGGDETVTTTFVAKDQMTPAVKGIQGRMASFKKDAMTGFGLAGGISVFGLATQGLGMVTDFLGEAGTAASDLNETQTKLNAVFRTSASTVREWASDSAQSMGQSTQAALEAAGTFGNFLQAMGQAEPAAADMSMAMVQLAGDLASFNNQDPTEVLDALRSGLSGETEPLRRFGVDISDAAVSAELLRQGLKKVSGQFTQAQKIQGRYALIMKQTATAQGDFARTADGTANAQRTLNAEIENGKAEIGQYVNEMVNGVTRMAVQTIPLIGNVGDAFNNLHRFIDPNIAALQDLEYEIRQQALATGMDGDAIWQYVRAAQVQQSQDEELVRVKQRLMDQFGYTAEAADAEARAQLGLTEATEEVAAATERHVTVAGEASRYLDEYRRSTVGMGAAMRSIALSYDSGLRGMGQATGKFKLSVRSIPEATTHAVVGMKRAIKEGKAGIVEQFRQLAWQSKHPFAQVNYEAWLERKQREATRKMKAAAKAGRPGVVEQYRQLIQDIRAELAGLPGYTQGIAADAMAQLAGIGPAVTNIMNGGLGGVSVDDPVKPRRRGKRGKRNRAMGGPTEAGGTYLVGENGPELLQMGSQRGNVTANHRLGAGPIVVNVDGRKLFEILDGRQGRAIAMGG